MDLQLGGKVVVISGGSEGIGYASARFLLQEGARVAICARRQAVLEGAAEELRRETRGEVLAVAADVSTEEGPRRVLEETLKRFGRVDALVNNAGTSRALPFESMTDEILLEDLQLKLFGSVRLTRLALPELRKAGGGAVVNLLNIAAKQPPAQSVPTSLSRAAGMALTKALSKELAKDNISVNAILIGLVKSGQHDRKWEQAGRKGSRDEFYAQMAKDRAVPMGRVAEADEAARLVAYLCSPASRYLTGTAINFDGGASAVV